MSGLVRRIRDELSLDASVGIGPNKLVAKVASDAEKPRGFVVLTRKQAAARFACEPPRLIPGIGPKTAERLEALGLRTIGDLQRYPADELVRRFGQHHGRSLHQRAHFHADSKVERRVAKSRSVETTFDYDISDSRGARARTRRAGEEPRAPTLGAPDRRPHDRDQGAARRLDDGHPGAHDRGRDQ